MSVRFPIPMLLAAGVFLLPAAPVAAQNQQLLQGQLNVMRNQLLMAQQEALQQQQRAAQAEQRAQQEKARADKAQKDLDDAKGKGSGTAAGAKGTVTLRGKPLADGKVTFHVKDGQFVGAKVKDGKYSLDRVPAGRWHVTVEGEGVPKDYTDEDATKLTADVKAGGGTFNFDVK